MNQVILPEKTGDICRLFRIYPTYIYHLEAVGRLPKRPKKKVTLEWLEELAKWYQKVRGELPKDARDLLDIAREKA